MLVYVTPLSYYIPKFNNLKLIFEYYSVLSYHILEPKLGS